MFEKKTLQQHINEFTRKVDSRESKIHSKIRELGEQAASIQSQIKLQADKIVELELNSGSPEQIDAAKKSNRELRLQLDELQDSIVGYQNQLERDPSLYAKDLEGIRQAANKAAADRKREMEKLSSTVDDKKAQIQALEKELAQVRHEWNVLYHHDDYYTFSSMLSYIDPRVTKLDHSKKEQFLKDWLSGSSSLERYFKEQPLSHQGIQRTVIPRQ
ncbi:hypothetical protein SAMN04488542_10571 [Fontibacillus panacisegetis]|uniref:Uncharacterized protein n=1 Tax=Fontibacillus panacisegetis TaxID=670482 RepID=A0A1G7HXA6_9BACL|nr:hypothetical protein [Fontibacillus panacisegetis]SDF05102.1 hypothetical protein SAMN04488542_10571 [Fontibacillus panacisegetis]